MKQALLLLWTLLILVAPAAAQGGSACGLPNRLKAGDYAIAQTEVNVRDTAGTNGNISAKLKPGDQVTIGQDAPQCINNMLWLPVSNDVAMGWAAESADGQYLLAPYGFTPEAPSTFNVPLTQPVISNPNVPLPTITPTAEPSASDLSFAQWNWAAFDANGILSAPDPLTLQLPAKYAGDLPMPPIDLSKVYFVKDANLNQQQLTLLAQNGFVVVPSSYQQFDDAYQTQDWDTSTGKAMFVTTDALLHSLFLTYQNALMFLEQNVFYAQVTDFVTEGYQAAEAQYKQAVGTPLEDAAKKAAIYYAVPLLLLADGTQSYQGQTPLSASPAQVIQSADQSIISAAQPLVDMAKAAQGQQAVPILEAYTEDFTQYKPRSYYAGDPVLESYFRAMMWLGRITFQAKSQADTLTGLLVLRALQSNPDALNKWQNVADTIDFLVGPVDDYGPTQYTPIAQTVFGQGLPLTALGMTGNVTTFQAQVKLLPPPKINSIPIPAGATSLDQVTSDEQGFRLFGQRFTFDGYVMQQLIYPAVGTDQQSRTLPMGLDVPATLGSNMAYSLTDAAGATQYAHYTDNMATLRNQVNGTSAKDWLQNIYGGWLWTLQPLAIRDANLTPPMMQTDAWKRKDLSTFLGSYTELKHATLLYAAQPNGGLGGGGMLPPLVSYGYVEPNPLVFARIAIISALLEQGLETRGYFTVPDNGSGSGLLGVQEALHNLGELSAMFAEMARKELAGEPFTQDEAYFLQLHIGEYLFLIRNSIEVWETNPPKTTALVADVASNAAAGKVLELGIGNPDLIYVITNSPYGPQLTRGAVYSDYEFQQDISNRLTDDDWRTQVSNGTQPARPDWIEMYFSK